MCYLSLITDLYSHKIVGWAVGPTLENVYPSFYIVKYDENQRNVTYSYTDILTRTVELQVFDGQAFSPIIPPEVEAKKKRKEYNIR